jgi:hypothetical protein
MPLAAGHLMGVTPPVGGVVACGVAFTDGMALGVGAVLGVGRTVALGADCVLACPVPGAEVPLAGVVVVQDGDGVA